MVFTFARELGLALALCSALAPFAYSQSAEPLKTVIPVNLDATTGNITVGATVYPGGNPGFHMLALKRQPNASHLDAPDLIANQTFTESGAANQFLQPVLSATPDALLLVNAVGNYGFALSSIAKNLEQFGSAHDIEGVSSAIPFVLIGNGGLNTGGAHQRGSSSLNLSGYLAVDSNGNYTLIQPDYVRFDIGIDGTITVGNKTYTAANAGFKEGGCNAAGSDSFHLVIVSRESPDTLLTDNVYCTGRNPSHLNQMAVDLNGVNSEGALVFIATNGHPIPADWNFQADGDGRVYPLAQHFRRFGGYWETGVYMTPSDTYSLVGAPAPPAGTPGAWNRGRESSSVYPDHPTGALHGVLARGVRGNWYSPLSVDPTGQANLDFYGILAQQPVPFPHPINSAELAAFQSIASQLCGSTTCNPRNNYSNTNIAMSTYLTLLAGIKDPQNNDCSDKKNATIPFCAVKLQLNAEFTAVTNIRQFNQNLQTLWLGSGTDTILELLSTYNNVQANLPAPPTAQAPSLAGPIVNLFLGVAGVLPLPPPVGALVGLAGTAFNFATSLTTDPSGDQTISLNTTVANLQQDAVNHFNAEATTTGTQFDFIYQDWGKISTLGAALENATPGTSWYWDSSATGRILQSMAPAIEQSYYQSLLAAVYAIGSYVPVCYLCPAPVNWGGTPLWQQPQAYTVDDPGGPFSPGAVPKAQPFNYGWYPPYTFPSDSTNPVEIPSNQAYTQATATLLAEQAWLGISAQTSPADSGPHGLYDPPALSILSHLFTPRSQGGLGVYRPAFFESWPFPRVTCAYSDDGDGDMGPGCNWGTAAPAPEAVQGPLTSLSITKGKSPDKFSVEGQIEVPLTITNNGTVAIQSIQITDVSLRTLIGSGQAVLADPALPLQLGSVAPGTFTTVNLHITVPSGIRKLAVTEGGTADNGELEPYRFSLGQAVFPGQQP